MGGKTPKQFLFLEGKPLIQRTLEAFQRHRAVHEIVVVVPLEYTGRTQRLVQRAKASKVSAIVTGGVHRQESVRHGLTAIKTTPDVVLVHDAVRPFVSTGVIHAVIREALRFGAAVVGTPVKDTVKVEERKGFYARTLPRDTLWGVQTPQGFRFRLLMEAHTRAQVDGFVGTDEASLLERLGKAVKIVEGDEWNIKVTTPHDLRLARFLARQGFPRR